MVVDVSKDVGVRIVFFSEGVVIENESVGVVVEGGGVGGGDGVCVVMYEGRFEGGDFFEFDVEVFFIGVDDFVVFVGSDSYWGDFVCESFVCLCSLGVFVRLYGIFVLLFLGDVMFFGGVFSVVIYVEFVVYVGEIVFD